MLTASAARWMLVLHTALGVAAVAAATHLVIWLRRYLRGQAGKRRAVIKFTTITLALQAGALLAGNVMYPTYKVEVRTAYLENGTAVAAQNEIHEQALARVLARDGQPSWEAPATADLVRRAARAARWFDVKEHWIALGLLASAALWLMLRWWDPERDGAELSPIALGLATIVCGTVWLGAVIGVLTASWRAV